MWDIKRKKDLDEYGAESARKPLCPAILQTNRAIYVEAARELYAKTAFAMEFSGIACVSDRETGHDMEKERATVWRHPPLRGMGHCNGKHLQVHASDRMSGHVEAHVFAKFESLNCFAHLDFDNEDSKPRLRVDKDHGFVVEDETQFGATLRQSDVIRNFVSLLSNSPYIDYLHMFVAIPLRPDLVSVPRSLTKEEDAQLYKRSEERKSAADRRAWELFLENNMLAPWRHCPTSDASNCVQS